LSLSLLLLLAVSGCSLFPQEKVVTKSEFVYYQIPIQERPRKVTTQDVRFHVVTEENMEEFLEKFKKENIEVVFFAISVKDYENLSLNVNSMKRFIQQQNNLLLYYETQINETAEKETVYATGNELRKPQDNK
jgi:GTPase involved in cell partitioning and DNA repair